MDLYISTNQFYLISLHIKVPFEGLLVSTQANRSLDSQFKESECFMSLNSEVKQVYYVKF